VKSPSVRYGRNHDRLLLGVETSNPSRNGRQEAFQVVRKTPNHEDVFGFTTLSPRATVFEAVDDRRVNLDLLQYVGHVRPE
jgi:hypothetical protein